MPSVLGDFAVCANLGCLLACSLFDTQIIVDHLSTALHTCSAISQRHGLPIKDGQQKSVTAFCTPQRQDFCISYGQVCVPWQVTRSALLQCSFRFFQDIQDYGMFTLWKSLQFEVVVEYSRTPCLGMSGHNLAHWYVTQTKKLSMRVTT